MMSEEKPASEKIKRLYGPCALIFCSADTGAWRILRPLIDDEKCVFCGTCEKYCPTGVVTIKKDKSSEKKNPMGSIDIDMTYCKGCGICADVCPKDAIAMIDEREV